MDRRSKSTADKFDLFKAVKSMSHRKRDSKFQGHHSPTLLRHENLSLAISTVCAHATSKSSFANWLGPPALFFDADCDPGVTKPHVQRVGTITAYILHVGR